MILAVLSGVPVALVNDISAKTCVSRVKWNNFQWVPAIDRVTPKNIKRNISFKLWVDIDIFKLLLFSLSSLFYLTCFIIKA